MPKVNEEQQEQVNQSQPLATERGETLRAAQGDGQSCVAGRELDALVAERVMGWSNVHYNGRTDRVSYKWMGIPPDGRTYNTEVRYFSTDIAAAMEVVERIIKTGFTFEFRWIAVWMARFDSLETGRHYGFTADDPRVPASEVICRAALAAVTHNAPEQNTES